MPNELGTFGCRVEGAGEARLFDNAVADETLEAINRYALRPLAAEDVAVYRMDLCNDQVDSYISRFPREELAKINSLVVGRPLMTNHDTRRLPRGRFFRSALHTAEPVQSVRPDFYLLRNERNATLLEDIDGGVVSGTSIGFWFETPECSVCGKDLRTCGHVLGREYSGVKCVMVIRDVTDVAEGSLVSLGAHGTEVVQALRRGPGDVELLGVEDALTAARDVFHEPYEIQGLPSVRDAERALRDAGLSRARAKEVLACGWQPARDAAVEPEDAGQRDAVPGVDVLKRRLALERELAEAGAEAGAGI